MTQSKFDFDKYNEVIKSANSGLKLHLAIKLLQEVEGTMVKFRSPFKDEMMSIVDELNDLKTKNKEYLEKQSRSTPPVK